jgi:hypothetical protein
MAAGRIQIAVHRRPITRRIDHIDERRGVQRRGLRIAVTIRRGSLEWVHADLVDQSLHAGRGQTAEGSATG